MVTKAATNETSLKKLVVSQNTQNLPGPGLNIRHHYINVADKVLDFEEVSCYALNCILMLFPKPNVVPKKSCRSES